MTWRPRLGDIVEVLRPAQVLLVSRNGPFAWAVRRVTGSPWTHAALIDRTEGGVWIAVEAVAAGVVGRRVEHYLEDAHYRALLVRDFPGITQAQRDEWCRAMWLTVGQGYDHLGLLGIFLRDVVGLPVTDQFDVRGRKFCSEGVTWAAAMAEGLKVALVPGEVPGQVAPGELATTPALQDVWAWSAA